MNDELLLEPSQTSAAFVTVVVHPFTGEYVLALSGRHTADIEIISMQRIVSIYMKNRVWRVNYFNPRTKSQSVSSPLSFDLSILRRCS